MSAYALRMPSLLLRRAIRNTRVTKLARRPMKILPRAAMFGGFAVMGYSLYHRNRRFSARCASQIILHGEHDDIEADYTPFNLLDALTGACERVSPHGMLELFQLMVVENGSQPITLQFLQRFFKAAGVDDEEVALHVFKVMDFDGSGKLEHHEVAAVMTLFQRGTDMDKFKFLFKCLDLDGNGVVDKDEFRQLLTALLMARYNLSGLHDPVDPDEIFTGIEKQEYPTVARWKANRMTRDIFIFADQNRDGELSMKEFLHWCRRGGREVDILRNVLAKTLGT